jgi:hypothetical protein
MRIMICLRSEAVSRAAQSVRYVVRGQTLGCARATKQLDAMLIPVGSSARVNALQRLRRTITPGRGTTANQR